MLEIDEVRELVLLDLVVVYGVGVDVDVDMRLEAGYILVFLSFWSFILGLDCGWAFTGIGRYDKDEIDTCHYLCMIKGLVIFSHCHR